MRQVLWYIYGTLDIFKEHSVTNLVIDVKEIFSAVDLVPNQLKERNVISFSHHMYINKSP